MGFNGRGGNWSWVDVSGGESFVYRGTCVAFARVSTNGDSHVCCLNYPGRDDIVTPHPRRILLSG